VQHRTVDDVIARRSRDHGCNADRIIADATAADAAALLMIIYN